MKKNIVVTGAASGIGYYVASQYAQSADYQVIGLDKQKIENANFPLIHCDLLCEEQVKQAFADIPHIDIAVNCAGVSSTRKAMLEFTGEEIIGCFSENFLAAFFAMQQELAMMHRTQSKGKIINIASITAHKGMKNFLAYSTAKAAILNMTKVAAIENADYGIQINSISPATIDTPLIRKKYHGQLRDYSRIFYTQNCGNVSDVFCVVKMLEENNFMTGSDIKLDGGVTDLLVI